MSDLRNDAGTGRGIEFHARLCGLFADGSSEKEGMKVENCCGDFGWIPRLPMMAQSRKIT